MSVMNFGLKGRQHAHATIDPGSNPSLALIMSASGVVFQEDSGIKRPK